MNKFVLKAAFFAVMSLQATTHGQASNANYFDKLNSFQARVVNVVETGDAQALDAFLKEVSPSQSFDSYVEDTLGVAAANGHIKVVQMLFQSGLIKNESKRKAIPSAAGGGRLSVLEFMFDTSKQQGFNKADIADQCLWRAVSSYSAIARVPQNNQSGIRDCVNYLMNLSENPPLQKSVDLLFSQVSQKGDYRILAIMAMDRQTGKLRTGLRPSDQTIKSVMEDELVIKEIKDFFADKVN